MTLLKLPVNPTDHFQGNQNANLILVEYGDFECPHCGRAHTLLKRLMEEKKGEILLVFRNFPLRKIHPNAYNAAVVAEAAARQNKFWEMHDLIFKNQRKLNSALLLQLAESLEINIDQFTDDLNDKVLHEKIETDFESGIRSGVNRTPTFFLNNQRIEGYDETYESLSEAIRQESEMNQRG